jgi:hypothetical protein
VPSDTACRLPALAKFQTEKLPGAASVAASFNFLAFPSFAIAVVVPSSGRLLLFGLGGFLNFAGFADQACDSHFDAH